MPSLNTGVDLKLRLKQKCCSCTHTRADLSNCDRISWSLNRHSFQLTDLLSSSSSFHETFQFWGGTTCTNRQVQAEALRCHWLKVCDSWSTDGAAGSNMCAAPTSTHNRYVKGGACGITLQCSNSQYRVNISHWDVNKLKETWRLTETWEMTKNSCEEIQEENQEKILKMNKNIQKVQKQQRRNADSCS